MRIKPEQSQAGRYRFKCRILTRAENLNDLGQQKDVTEDPYTVLCQPYCEIQQNAGDQQQYRDQQIAARSYTISLRGRRSEVIKVGDRVDFVYRGQSEVCFIQSIVDSEMVQDELVLSVSSRSLTNGEVI